MMFINMQYFGGNGASSGKGSGGGKASGGGAAAKNEEKRNLQSEFDKATATGKISMLRNNEDATEASEALWEHAKSEGKVVQVTSESSKGDYIRENREYVKGTLANSLASQTDAVRNNTGESSFLYKGSKGNIYMATYNVKGKEVRKTLRMLPWK